MTATRTYPLTRERNLILGTLPRQGEIEIFLDREKPAFREAMGINTIQ